MAVTFTVVLAEEQPLIRQALRTLLEAQPGIAVVGEAADGPGVLGLIGQVRPDVLVVNLALSGLGGSELPRTVKQRSPHTRVVVLSAHARRGYVLGALRNGADGVVGRQSTAADLVKALHTVMAGRRYLGAGVVEADLLAPETGEADPYESLTAREREVVHLAAEGCGNTEIAQRLGVSPRTVETHRAHAMHKLGLRSQPDLIRYALRRGVLVPDSDEA